MSGAQRKSSKKHKVEQDLKDAVYTVTQPDQDVFTMTIPGEMWQASEKYRKEKMEKMSDVSESDKLFLLMRYYLVSSVNAETALNFLELYLSQGGDPNLCFKSEQSLLMLCLSSSPFATTLVPRLLACDTINLNWQAQDHSEKSFDTTIKPRPKNILEALMFRGQGFDSLRDYKLALQVNKSAIHPEVETRQLWGLLLSKAIPFDLVAAMTYAMRFFPKSLEYLFAYEKETGRDFTQDELLKNGTEGLLNAALQYAFSPGDDISQNVKKHAEFWLNKLDLTKKDAFLAAIGNTSEKIGDLLVKLMSNTPALIPLLESIYQKYGQPISVEAWRRAILQFVRAGNHTTRAVVRLSRTTTEKKEAAAKQLFEEWLPKLEGTFSSTEIIIATLIHQPIYPIEFELVLFLLKTAEGMSGQERPLDYRAIFIALIDSLKNIMKEGHGKFDDYRSARALWKSLVARISEKDKSEIAASTELDDSVWAVPVEKLISKKTIALPPKTPPQAAVLPADPAPDPAPIPPPDQPTEKEQLTENIRKSQGVLSSRFQAWISPSTAGLITQNMMQYYAGGGVWLSEAHRASFIASLSSPQKESWSSWFENMEASERCKNQLSLIFQTYQDLPDFVPPSDKVGITQYFKKQLHWQAKILFDYLHLCNDDESRHQPGSFSLLNLLQICWYEIDNPLYQRTSEEQYHARADLGLAMMLAVSNSQCHSIPEARWLLLNRMSKWIPGIYVFKTRVELQTFLHDLRNHLMKPMVTFDQQPDDYNQAVALSTRAWDVFQRFGENQTFYLFDDATLQTIHQSHLVDPSLLFADLFADLDTLLAERTPPICPASDMQNLTASAGGAESALTEGPTLDTTQESVANTTEHPGKRTKR